MTLSRDQGMVQQLIPGLIGPADVDWGRVLRSRYLIDQTFRYRYPAPIAQLRQRLVIEPPHHHGRQWGRRSRFRTSAPGAVISRSCDGFGNTVIEVEAQEAGPELEFEARIEVEREHDETPVPEDVRWLQDARLLRCERLTAAGDRVHAAATAIARERLSGLQLAERVTRWTHHSMRYESGVTSICTSAEEALGLGRGVCQDYAHVMLALCRTLGLAARYVSGHLLGEGGTHAWVEVVLPATDGFTTARPEAAEVHAFDPTHGRPAGPRYVTVAVGADYWDVAPTSGTYHGEPGELSARKRVDIVGLAYG